MHLQRFDVRCRIFSTDDFLLRFLGHFDLQHRIQCGLLSPIFATSAIPSTSTGLMCDCGMTTALCRIVRQESGATRMPHLKSVASGNLYNPFLGRVFPRRAPWSRPTKKPPRSEAWGNGMRRSVWVFPSVKGPTNAGSLLIRASWRRDRVESPEQSSQACVACRVFETQNEDRKNA